MIFKMHVRSQSNVFPIRSVGPESGFGVRIWNPCPKIHLDKKYQDPISYSVDIKEIVEELLHLAMLKNAFKKSWIRIEKRMASNDPTNSVKALKIYTKLN